MEHFKNHRLFLGLSVVLALLLKTFTYVIKYGGVDLVPNQKLHPCWLALMAPEGSLYATEGEGQLSISTNNKAYDLQP